MRALACLALACLALGGCVRPDTGLTHIQFSIWGSVLQMKVEMQLVSQFESLHPDIKVDVLPIGSHYPDKIQAMMVGDVAPDVMMVEYTQTFEWSSRGVLLDLTPDMDQLAREATLMPLAQQAYAPDGHFYALPINCSGFVMYCNQDALEKAGIPFPYPAVSWEYLRGILPRLSSRHGDPHAPTDYALLMPPANLLFWQWGANVFDDPIHPTKVTVNCPQAIAALDFDRSMYNSGYVVPPEVANDQGTYQLFRDGKLAFYFTGRWNTPDFQDKTQFRWDVAPMPCGPVSGATNFGGTGLAVYSKTRHPEAAREFARFYASRQGSEIAMRGMRTTPVWREVAFGDEFLSLRPPASIRRFAETMEAGASQSATEMPGMQEVGSIFGNRVEQAHTQPQVPTAEVVAGLESDLNRWLERRRKKGDL